jgi:hypothetical protein
MIIIIIANQTRIISKNLITVLFKVITNTSVFINKFVVDVHISFVHELQIHPFTVVLSHFTALYIVQGIFIKNKPIALYQIDLFAFDNLSSSVHIDIIICAHEYTKNISKTQENTYLILPNMVNVTFETVSEISELDQLIAIDFSLVIQSNHFTFAA